MWRNVLNSAGRLIGQPCTDIRFLQDGVSSFGASDGIELVYVYQGSAPQPVSRRLLKSMLFSRTAAVREA